MCPPNNYECSHICDLYSVVFKFAESENLICSKWENLYFTAFEDTEIHINHRKAKIWNAAVVLLPPIHIKYSEISKEINVYLPRALKETQISKTKHLPYISYNKRGLRGWKFWLNAMPGLLQSSRNWWSFGTSRFWQSCHRTWDETFFKQRGKGLWVVFYISDVKISETLWKKNEPMIIL